MAWNIHWQCVFKSLQNITYALNIYEQNYSGSIVQLTGSDKPFITQENESDDIFTPVRGQTGFLSVIDYDGTLAEQLIPTNNTEKLVRLMTGTYNVNNNSFVPDTTNPIKWQGFLQAQVFTQPWDGNANIIEFPVISLLEALKTIFIKTSVYNTIRMAKLYVDAFTELLGSVSDAASSVTKMILIDNVSGEYQWPNLNVEIRNFFTQELQHNQGDVYSIVIGESYYDILANIAKLYGLVFRENGTTIYCSAYDKDNLRAYEYFWQDIIDIASGMYVWLSPSDIDRDNILDAIDFAGTGNDVSYIQGGKYAKVVLDVDERLPLNVSLLPTTEDATPILEKEVYFNGTDTATVYAQNHPPRTNNVETFAYYMYSRHTYMGISDYPEMVLQTIMTNGGTNPYASEYTLLYTGAYPVRWYYRANNAAISLKNGLFLNAQYSNGNNLPTDKRVIYSVESELQYTFSNGWLNIKALLQSFIWMSTPNIILFGQNAQLYFGSNVKAELQVALQFGDKFWDKENDTWVNGSPTTVYFTLFFTNTIIDTNITSDIITDVNDGYFIPIHSEITGVIKLHILNVIYIINNNIRRISYSHILSDLEITHHTPQNAFASERTQNTYFQEIIKAGFSDTKEVNLEIGTFNNNLPMPVFLKNDDGEYVEAFSYYNTPISSSTQTTIDRRPELSLLDRMVNYYGEIRRTFRGVVKSGINFFTTKYTYLSRVFFCICTKNEWKEDKNEVKFIEV